jgi:hypothetical protein
VEAEQLAGITAQQLRDAVTELAVQIARQGAGDTRPDGTEWTDREVRLAVLAATRLIRTQIDVQLGEAAELAAAAGADYGEIGRSVGLSRQAARQRWPHLAAVTRATRG